MKKEELIALLKEKGLSDEEIKALLEEAVKDYEAEEEKADEKIDKAEEEISQEEEDKKLKEVFGI